MAYLGFVPSGVLLSFAGSTAPQGWVLCDGSAISRTVYASLFAALGTTYGTGDGSTTFNLPDMRGVFPRGSGTNGTANYGGVTGHTPAGGALGSKGGQKTAKNGLATSSSSVTGVTGSNSSSSVSVSSTRNVGATPAQEIANNFNSYGAAGGFTAYTYNAGSSALSSTGTASAQSWSQTGSGTAAAQTITGDSETTPAFLAVNYIIKI